MSAYTKPPWKIEAFDFTHMYHLTGPGVLKAPTQEELRANERLMSAAPELLGACKEVIKELEFHALDSVYNILLAAIEKAEGTKDEMAL